MSLRLVVSMVRQGIRNIHRGGVWFVFATTMCTLGLFALSVFLTVVQNFKTVADEMGDSIGAVCFLDVDGVEAAAVVQKKIARIQGVQRAELISPDQARARVKKALPPGTSVDLRSIAMPFVVDVSFTVTGGSLLNGDSQNTSDAKNLLHQLAQLPGVDEVMHPGGELSKVHALGKVLTGGAAFLGLVIALVTVVVISNTVRLTLFARREEIGIMKLVGATDLYVRVPFLLEGGLQGVVGAFIALVLCYAAHASFAGWVQLALSSTLGSFVLSPLSLPTAVLLVISGGALGFFGAALSIGRFLRV
ncbi:MAG: ABC transporter permease [Deltaproteobacteria bacterium]|nr:ABC transporter permease [Deltaproteobacteria bacterium]